MAKTYKVLVNDGKGAESVAVQVAQGAGDKGTPVRLVAQRGVRYELQDVTKGKGVAPDQVRAKRVGNNLTLMFDGSQAPDVVIEDYYIVKGEGAAPMLAGLAENGGVYEYIPQDPNVNHLTPSLKDGNTPVLMALGGGALGEAFVLSALPIVAAAAGGISGWAIAAGVVGAAALGGGGGVGGGTPPTDTTPPAPFKANLKHDALNDTGVNSVDSVTNNATPVLQINAETGAKVEVEINGKTYAATETDTKGTYEVKVTDALPDGTYTPVVRVTDAAGNTTVDGVFVGFTVAGSGGASGPISSTRTISIVGISDDTGTSGTDFVTTDKTLKVNGLVTGVTATDIEQGKRVLVQFIDASGKEISQAYVTPVADKWATTADTAELPVGKYTVKATIVDLAGNPFEQTSRAVEVTAGQLLAVADQSNVSEDHLLQNIGNVLSGTGESKQGADIDAQYSYGPNIVVNAVTFGATAITPSMVFSDTAFHLVDGNYGTLKIRSAGDYVYVINTALAQPLQGTQVEHDVFTYQVKNAAGLISTATLTVDVSGKNDVPSTVGVEPIQVTYNLSGGFSNGTSIQISDLDTDESQYVGISKVASTSLVGSYGTFIVTPDGAAYKWSYQKTASPSGEATVHDLFVLQSHDGTAAETVDITLINGDLNFQEFHTKKTAGLTAVGRSGKTDTLVLHDGSLLFDFTNPTPVNLTSESIKKISSIEKIDITDSNDQTIKLSLASLTQADLDGTVHKLYIKGDAGDVVELTKPTPTWDTAAHLSTRVVSDVTYNVYQLDSTHELLINNAISTLTVS